MFLFDQINESESLTIKIISTVTRMNSPMTLWLIAVNLKRVNAPGHMRHKTFNVFKLTNSAYSTYYNR